ncbi:NtaA/DmoA family FMN-dependent monooxygenase [Mycolicibacterium sp. CBM1]
MANFGYSSAQSAEDLAAQNFGLDELPAREERYARADEFVEVVTELFASWDPDAVVLDRTNGVYADPSKIRPIRHRGKHFAVRGPLNTVPSPQHRPAFIQAGASPRGRAFAATHADSVIAIAHGKEGMKEFRDDVRAKAAAAGRDPDSIKVLFCITPTVAETVHEAQIKREREVTSPQFITEILAQVSAITEIDFAAFDLDLPLPYRLTTNGEQGSLDQLQQWGSGKTLRELVLDSAGGLVSSLDLVGTPDSVAEQMGEAMEFAGGDGFIITTPLLRLSRHFVADITEGLVPALQRRGLTRTEYTVGNTLRDNLTEF